MSIELSQSFGYEAVSSAEREHRIRAVFEAVGWRNLSMGIACLHMGGKPLP